MSDSESPLSRWSRRKREATKGSRREDSSAPVHPAPDAPADAAAAGAQPAAPLDSARPALDLSKLPSLEEIAADTDITGFLGPGVPPDLKMAALRRAWSADPRIRDFVGLNDYDFDFHTPGAISGFGPLEMTPELHREVARILGTLPAPDVPPEPAGGPPEQATVIADTAADRPMAVGVPVQPGSPDRAESAQAPEQSEPPAGRVERTATLEAHKVFESHPVSAAEPQADSSESERLPVSPRRAHGRALPQ